MMLVMKNFKHFLSAVAMFILLTVGVNHIDTQASGTEPVRLLVFGDSLVAGYGLPQNEAFPVRLEHALRAKGHNVDALNGGVSGDTSAGGVSRIDWALTDKPDAVLVVLGGNDALRGLPPDSLATNLDTILLAIAAEGLPAMVAGMKAPSNMGESYGRDFDQAFADVMGKAASRDVDVMFYPFFLEGVALVPELNQDDGIHPNPDGVSVIVENILPHVEQLLSTVEKD